MDPYSDFTFNTSTNTLVGTQWIILGPTQEPPLSGDREPRQPLPAAPAGSMALEVEYA